MVAFTLLAILGFLGALMVLFHRKPIYNALGLLLNFLALAGMYFLLNAPFIGVLQIIVYSGAIVVFFLFVIMMVNLRDRLNDYDLSFKGLLSFVIVISIAVGISIALFLYKDLPKWSVGVEATPERIGELLLKRYVVPFELASILILVAIVIAIVLGRRGEEG